MNTRTSFWFLIAAFVLFFVTSTGCSSPPSTVQPQGNETLQGLSVGDTAVIAMPDGTLDVTVRSFNASTGAILLEEKNNGTAPLRYNPVIRIQDREGGTYPTVYCHADLCPEYVFLTTLPPGETETRDISLSDMFHVPDEARRGNLSLFWADFGHEASWVLIP